MELIQTNYTKTSANETLIVFHFSVSLSLFLFSQYYNSRLLRSVFKCIGWPPKQLLYLNLKTEDAASCFQANFFWVFFTVVFKPLKPIQKMSMGKQKKPEVYGEWKMQMECCALLTFVCCVDLDGVFKISLWIFFRRWMQAMDVEKEDSLCWRDLLWLKWCRR